MNMAQDPAALPSLVFAEAILPTRSGESPYAKLPVAARNVERVFADPDVVGRARELLSRAGFSVSHTRPIQARPGTAADVQVGDLASLSIAGPPDLFRAALKANLATIEIEQTSFGQQRRQSTHLIFSGLEIEPGENETYISGRRGALAGVVEGVALARPARLFAPSPVPPVPGYFHLALPDVLANRLGADIVHNQVTGAGIRVAMVDTGHFWHPFFEAQGYRRPVVILAPLTADPNQDEHGHGTGESANLFAIAPRVTLILVKARMAGADELPLKDSLLSTTQAFKVAASLNPPPHIITCSWGYDLANRNDLLRYDALALQLAIADAVSKNIVVVFAAGNGDHGFPAQHPDVIAAGGVFMTENNELQASNYTSGFVSGIYRRRRVPDICGLVGMAPFGRYLMLPVPPSSRIDEACSQAGGDGDGTTANDGWAVFSGTSAAAPQIAGVIALMLQAEPALTPKQVKRILRQTARDVESGQSAAVAGIIARPGLGTDLATGAGLVDAAGAVNRAIVG